MPDHLDPDQLALGKKLGVVHDFRTLMARELFVPELTVRVPAKHRIGGLLTKVPVFGNDELGDCTQASIGHYIVTNERSSSQHEIPLTTDDIINAYVVVGGYVRGRPETDNGAYELESMNNWRRNGIGVERDGTTHKIKAFAAVDWRERGETIIAHYVFGGLKVCAGLPLSAADQIRGGYAWTLTSGPRAAFGGWGGHSMYSYAYSNEGLWVWTWGRPQLMTWPWVSTYVDECYAVISEDAVRRGGTTPQGFNEARLDDFLASL